jgi:hypothetical protein
MLLNNFRKLAFVILHLTNTSTRDLLALARLHFLMFLLLETLLVLHLAVHSSMVTKEMCHFSVRLGMHNSKISI